MNRTLSQDILQGLFYERIKAFPGLAYEMAVYHRVPIGHEERSYEYLWTASKAHLARARSTTGTERRRRDLTAKRTPRSVTSHLLRLRPLTGAALEGNLLSARVRRARRPSHVRRPLRPLVRHGRFLRALVLRCVVPRARGRPLLKEALL